MSRDSPPHRLVALDTETTGLRSEEGHRIVQLGCVEIVDRSIGEEYSIWLNPEREVDEKASEVHGKTLQDLETEPKFADIVEKFVDFIRGAELIIHNATFDVGFINAELRHIKYDNDLDGLCSKIHDSLLLAQKKYPGSRNSLDALCNRFHIRTDMRQHHDALVDAKLLAQVWLSMTGGQAGLKLETSPVPAQGRADGAAGRSIPKSFKVLRASAEEVAAHREFLAKLAKKKIKPLWED